MRSKMGRASLALQQANFRFRCIWSEAVRAILSRRKPFNTSESWSRMPLTAPSRVPRTWSSETRTTNLARRLSIS